MTRLLVASENDRPRIAALFRAELPDFQILTDLAEIGSEGVPYIVAGKPEPGLIGAVPGVRAVLSLNAGVDHLLAGGEVPEDVPIARLVDHGLAEGMVEWVLAHTLAWHRNILLYRQDQASKNWAPRSEMLARERVVTVLGAGQLGYPVATHLIGIGFQTRVWSRSGRAVAGATAFQGRDGLMDAVAGTDVLISLLPLTPETTDLLDAGIFAAMRGGGLVINGARGAQVVEADLIAALDSGQLSGAALDVFRTEPLPADSPLWSYEKILVSPHVAAPTHVHIAVEEIAANIRRHQRNEPLLNVVDRHLGY
ncbi:MAG: 2-hydroxyacid dehydrogenase [Inquilinaceae bacterium]